MTTHILIFDLPVVTQISKPKQNVLAGQSSLETHPCRPEIKIIPNLAICNIPKLAKNMMFGFPLKLY